jgi:hypothetical protein
MIKAPEVATMRFSSFQFRWMYCALTALSFCAARESKAAKVWESTFDTTADGVVDIIGGPEFGVPAKEMIGSVTDGKLQITAWDNTTNSFSPDKAGRPLMLDESQVPIKFENGDDDMSAQYKFRWSDLNDDEVQAYELAGFLGNTTAAQTRQVMGALIRHHKVANDYYASLDVAVGSVGFTNFGYKASSSFFLGPNAEQNDYELRIEYNGDTHFLRLQLLDNVGALIGENQADLDVDVPGLLQPTPAAGAQEINAMSFTHLGWEDYTGNGGNRATAWEVNSLAWWDEPQVPGTFTPDADYNDDGQVDAADYVLWRKNFGSTGTPGSIAGDGTSNDLLGVPDGKVDQFDYDFWKSRFGNPQGSGGGSGLNVSNISVPEPASTILIGVALLSWLPSARKRTS